MKFIRLVVLLLFFYSCSKEVELKPPHYQPSVVVDGYIETGRVAQIYLTLSSPYLTYYDSLSIIKTFLNHAKITLTSSKGEREVLTLYRELRFFPPFVYKSVYMKGEVGIRYDIEVEVNNQVITASTTIPRPPVVTAQKFIPETDSTGYPSYSVTLFDKNEVYLFPRVKSAFSKENFHPTLKGVAAVSAKADELVEQKIYRVQEVRVYSYSPESFYYNSYPSYQYDLSDTVWILPGAVDSVSYRVLSSLFTNLSEAENPFAFNGNYIQTNIKGGLGRWTGIGTAPVIEVTYSEP